MSDTLARLAAGGELHTVMEAECVGECMMFWLCRDMRIKIRLREPLLWQLHSTIVLSTESQRNTRIRDVTSHSTLEAQMVPLIVSRQCRSRQTEWTPDHSEFGQNEDLEITDQPTSDDQTDIS